MVNLLRSAIPNTIEIQLDIDDTCGTVIADPANIHQVLMNLLTNAYQALLGGSGVIRAGISEETFAGGKAPESLSSGRYAVIRIRDTGVGIEDAVVDRIFDPYFTTKSHADGTGMGLSASYGIVSELGGDILVTSEEGSGSEFVFFALFVRRIARPISCLYYCSHGQQRSDRFGLRYTEIFDS